MSKPLLTIRATITHEGGKPQVWEVDAHMPKNPTPQNLAAEIDDAFAKIRKAVEEELL